MLDAKLVADLITVTRGFLGLVLAWLGLTQGKDALPLVTFLMILCWTGDYVDGSIARRSRHPRQTWMGNHDIQVDIFVSLGLGIYLIGAGFVTLAFGAGYMLIWALVIWHFGPDRNLLMLLQAPIYAYFMWIAVTLSPRNGRWLVLWVIAVTSISWRRFSHQVVPKFVDGMKSLWKGHTPRHS